MGEAAAGTEAAGGPRWRTTESTASPPQSTFHGNIRTQRTAAQVRSRTSASSTPIRGSFRFRADCATLRSRRVGNPPLDGTKSAFADYAATLVCPRPAAIHLPSHAPLQAAPSSRPPPSRGTGEGLRSKAQGEGAAARGAR